LRRPRPKLSCGAKERRRRRRRRTGFTDDGDSTSVYPKVSGLATWSETYKRYTSLPIGAVLSLFCESV
jgi:hypothetical protein